MKAILLASLVGLAPWLAPADELKRQNLPAAVDFVVHLDLEGLQATTLWKHLSEQIESEDSHIDLGEFEQFKQRFGIDPFRDVRAVTLYKVETEEEPTVVLLSARAKIDEALKKFQAEPGYERRVASSIELHTWKEDEGDTVFAYVHPASEADRVIVLASSEASALRAARVLRGEEPSHAQAGTLLPVTPGKGSFLYLAAAHIPQLDEFPPASQVFGLAQGIQVDLGEAGGLLRGHMGLATGSAQDAFDVSGVVNGLLSLARLAGGQFRQLIELINGLRLSTNGTQVVLDFEYGVERLMEIFQELEDLDLDEGAGF